MPTKTLDERLEEAINSWASGNLRQAWVILQMTDWEDGEAVLREGDINSLCVLVAAANKEIWELKRQLGIE